MISWESLRNKLRELGYVYVDQTKRVEMWKKKGGTHCAHIRMRNLHAEDYVKILLRQCGETPEGIEAFLKAARS